MTTYWHVAPSSARESIAENGIDYRLGESPHDIDFEEGNYLFGDESAAHRYAEVRWEYERDTYGSDAEKQDVYRVETDVPVQLDQFRDDESGLGVSSVFTREAIPPSDIRLDI